MTKNAFLLGLIFFAVTLWAEAQHQSRLGQFQVDKIRGCNPLTITVSPIPPFQCDSSNPCAAFYDFVNQPTTSEPLITPPFSHTYTQPGIYTLSLLMGTLRDDIQIEVFPNTPPTFEVYLCGNNEVSVNITDTAYDQYVINYNDGSPDVVRPVGNNAKDTHQYAGTGVETITVRGRMLNADDNCNGASQNVTPVMTIPGPSIAQLRVTDNTTIDLALNTSPNVLYRLEIATNSATAFQLYKTLYNVNTETLANLNPDNSFYCFRLGAVDPCNNQTIYSPTICSVNLDLTVNNNVNNLAWATSANGASAQRLQRSITGSSITTTVTGLSYADTDLVCGTEYCYQLTLQYPNGSSSVSLQKCGTAISTDIPDAIKNITAAVGPNGLMLEWQAPVSFTPEEFFIHRSLNNYDVIAATPALQFFDNTYTTESGACYRLSYRDACDNTSPASLDVCPIRLTASLQADNVINLSWTAYQGWAGGATGYVVEKYSTDGLLLQMFNAGNALSFSDNSQDLDNQAYIYIVKANAVDPSLSPAASNAITVIKDPNLFYPRGFTPNGDNLNDIFNVYGQYIVTFEMNIFNRWGELMYTTNDLDQGWDGTYRGNPMPEGTYTFVADITDRAGRTFKKSGSVLLLRKR